MMNQSEALRYGKQTQASTWDKDIVAWVRRRPLMIDHENKEAKRMGGVYRVYFAQTQFAITGEMGSREVVMIDPLLASRTANRRNPLGRNSSEQGRFRSATILHANISAYEAGKLNEDELKRLYPGLSIEEMKHLRNHDIGKILYGEFTEDKPIETNLRSDLDVVFARGNGDESNHVWMIPKDHFISVRKAMEKVKKQRSSRRIRVISASGVLLVAAAACAPLAIQAPGPTEATNTFVPRPTATEAPKVTPTSVPELAFSGGPLDLQKLLEDPILRARYENSIKWYNFWTSADPDQRKLYTGG